MKFLQYAKVIFFILSCVVLSFILPIIFIFAYNEYEVLPSFLIPMIPTLLITLVLVFTTKNYSFKLSTRGGICLVAFAWILTCLLGALPFFISGAIQGFSNCVFESTSGFTTTGATILNEIEGLPKSILIWRAQTHWLGGMGIIVLAVALFPLLGIGGFTLIKSETTGPDKGKITPKIAETAKALWYIYASLTLIQILALLLAGMNLTDAISHSFSTLGTGGFSTKNASIGTYNSSIINYICTVFMFLAAINFSLYIRMFQGHPEDTIKNSEFRAFIKIFFTCAVLLGIAIIPKYGVFKAFEHSFFQVASVMSTTGFSSVNYNTWPEIAKFILLFLFLIGGCSGSTAGGIKVVRWVILKKQAGNEMKRVLYPHGVFSIQLNRQPGRMDVVYSVAGFIFLYLFLVVLTSCIAVLAGANVFSSIVTGLTLVGNIGAGFDMIAPDKSFLFFADWAKYFFSFSMIAGRLELYTMLIMFNKNYWRK